MALWGKTDNAANSVMYAVNQFGLTANTDNETAFFGNTSAWAADSKLVAGQFGVSAAETTVSSGNVALGRVLTAGSGYAANATVTFTVTNGGSGAVANAQVGATGRVTAINISTAGSGYKTNPTIVISAPAAVAFNGNTAVSSNATLGLITLASANSKFLANDKATLSGNATSIPVGLVNGTTYYISFSNTTVVALASTLGGANLVFTDATGDTTTAGGAALTGETATGFVETGAGQNKGATAGWNIRTAGTGGRAGRIQYECLVAMSNITSDASDDSILPDA
jgi:hypothetical protein